MSDDIQLRVFRSTADRVAERVPPDRSDAVRTLAHRIINEVYAEPRAAILSIMAELKEGPRRAASIEAELKRGQDAFAKFQGDHDGMAAQLDELRARLDNSLRGDDDDGAMNAAIVQRAFALPTPDAIMLVRTTNDARIVRALRDFPAELNPIPAEFITQAVTRLGARANPKLAAQIAEVESVQANVAVILESVRIALDELTANTRGRLAVR
jgi:hypothetical protein